MEIANSTHNLNYKPIYIYLYNGTKKRQNVCAEMLMVIFESWLYGLSSFSHLLSSVFVRLSRMIMHYNNIFNY